MNANEALSVFRAEMLEQQSRMASLASDFLELHAYEDAAKCAMKAEVLKWVIGRIPQVGRVPQVVSELCDEPCPCTPDERANCAACRQGGLIDKALAAVAVRQAGSTKTK